MRAAPQPAGRRPVRTTQKPWPATSFVPFQFPDEPGGHQPTNRRTERGAPKQGKTRQRPLEQFKETPDLPDPDAWARWFLQGALEVSTGRRPPGQLAHQTTPVVYELLSRRGRLTSQFHHANGTNPPWPTIRAVRSCIPRTGVCEIGAVVATDRIRAVALRMEAPRGHWRVTEMIIG